MDDIDFTERMLLLSFQQPQDEPHHFNNDYWLTNNPTFDTPDSNCRETISTSMPKKISDTDDLLPLVTPSKESDSFSSLTMEEPSNQSQEREPQPQTEEDESTDEEVSALIAQKFPSSHGSIVPTKFDILCGQSRICASHTGNRRFQVVLDTYAERYDAVTSKQEKMNLTKEIVGCIHASNGRFLKYKNGSWTEISNVLARDKVSHALRTKVASWKRQKEEAAAPKTTEKAKSPARKTHRRKSSSGGRRRRSSTSIMTSSFDATDSTAKNAVMEDLLRAQREIFASLTEGFDEDAIHPLKI